MLKCDIIANITNERTLNMPKCIVVVCASEAIVGDFLRRPGFPLAT